MSLGPAAPPEDPPSGPSESQNAQIFKGSQWFLRRRTLQEDLAWEPQMQSGGAKPMGRPAPKSIAEPLPITHNFSQIRFLETERAVVEVPLSTCTISPRASARTTRAPPA